MDKIDYKKERKDLYRPSAKKVDVVVVPKMNFLMVDGEGDPNPDTSADFRNAVEVLFPLSYTIKFAVKKSGIAIDYGVLPLEGRWWAEDMSTFSVDKKEDWKWTLMMRQPELVTEGLVRDAMESVREKKNPASLSQVRFEAFDEGKVAQVMHLGPFTEEGPTVERVHAFIEESGGELCGQHHEIYLSDIRRAAPENWKTIIRQPFS